MESTLLVTGLLMSGICRTRKLLNTVLCLLLKGNWIINHLHFNGGFYISSIELFSLLPNF